MPEDTTSAIVAPAAAVTFTLNAEDIVIGGTTLISSSNVNYNNLVNGAIASPANGVPVIIDNPIVNLRLVEIRNGTPLTFAGTPYTDLSPVSFSDNGAIVSFGNTATDINIYPYTQVESNAIIIDDLNPSLLNRLKAKNYKAIRLSDEKKVFWDGTEVLWIYDTKSEDLDAILIKDIRFKLCCPKNDFNYNYYDHNDNGGEGFSILIGDSNPSLIEVC